LLSHICLPESTLKRFSNSGILYYLDIKNKNIRKSPASSFLTANDYYTQETEAFLSKKLESKMGKIYESIDRFKRRQKPNITVVKSTKK